MVYLKRTGVEIGRYMKKGLTKHTVMILEGAEGFPGKKYTMVYMVFVNFGGALRIENMDNEGWT